MAKLRLVSSNPAPMTGLELEIAREQAESLGLAGKRLQESIDRHASSVQHNESAACQSKLLGEISNRAWALMVQRELVGFKHEALRWVVDNFDIPEAALSQLGRRHED